MNEKKCQWKHPKLMWRERKKKERKKGISSNWGQLQMMQQMSNGNTRRRAKREMNRINIWSKNDWKFSKISDSYQTTGPGSSEANKQDKFQNNLPIQEKKYSQDKGNYFLALRKYFHKYFMKTSLYFRNCLKSFKKMVNMMWQWLVLFCVVCSSFLFTY